jgi:ribosomal protein S18 acetylase RimI-like enzyme
MPENEKIIKAGPSDAPLVRMLVAQFKKSAVSEAYLAGVLSNPANLLFVALLNQVVVGFLWAHRLDRLPEGRPHFFIYEIDVLQEHQRRGIGRKLIEATLSVARQNDAETFVLTNRSNQQAVRFYRATGGEVESSDDLLFVYKRAAQAGG